MVETNQKLRLLINAFAPPFVWALVIFAFSSQQSLPGFEASAFDFFLKKFAHMFVYGVLYFLLARGVEMVVDQKKNPKTRLFLPVLIVLFYAMSDEMHQSFVPNRYATLRDVGYDILGTSLVLLKKFRYI
jgi:VanZ family protein